jgi:hypothetical protein
MKVSIFLLLLSQTIILVAQETAYSWQGKIISKINQEPVPNAYLKVVTENNSFAFIANEEGEAEIWSVKIKPSDTVIISSVGYKPFKSSCLELLSNPVITLEPVSYSVGEVVVTPIKKKTVKLGNLATYSLNSFSGDYGNILALYIPSNGYIGKIKKVRFFMQDLFEKNYKYFPFRIRVYRYDTINKTVGKDLLTDQLIVSLKKGSSNWIEVNISAYNITLPEEGVVIGAEILPKAYYKAKKYLTKENLITELLKAQYPNVPFFGSTTSMVASKDGMFSLGYTAIDGWVKAFEDDSNFLINIDIDLTK